MSKKKKSSFKTCRFVEQEGQYAVFVTHGCRNVALVKAGKMVTPKKKCRDCLFWEPREGEGDEKTKV